MTTVPRLTITVFSENTPGVLYRIANLFLRRKINIESLTVSEIEAKSLSRFTIVVKEDVELVKKIAKQLERIVEVFEVFVHTDEELTSKEVALIKVAVKSKTQYEQIEKVVAQFFAYIVRLENDGVVIQKTGSEEDIDFLHSVLEPFGIKETVRSGRIALAKKPARTPFASKEPKGFSKVTSAIEVSMIKQIEMLAKKETDVISLAQGIPSFFTPDHIKQAAKKAMDKNLTDKYTSGYGIEPLRTAMAEKIQTENKISISPEEIIVTHGAIEGMMAIFMAILNPDDEIIVLTPDYASHITQIIIATYGAKPVEVPLTETPTGWLLDPEKIEQAITPKTKVILICNPCNPTGKVYSREELSMIAKIAGKHNLYVISDEMYEHFVYDGKKHISIGSFKEIADKTISVFGVSKSYAMTGWRIGYIAARKPVIENIFKIHDSLITCPTAVSQYAALTAITGPQDSVRQFKKAYEKRRDIVTYELAKTDRLEYTIPQGAYYGFPKIKGNIDDVEFAMQVIKEAKVAVVPGSAFGQGGESHIRLLFACEEEILQEGLKRLVEFLNNNKI